MPRTSFAWAAGLLLAVGAAAAAPRDNTGPIAVSNGVEIRDIAVERRRAAYAAVGADLTTAAIDLWFTTPADRPQKLPVHTFGRSGFVVRLVSLDEIADDTGKVLLTADRRKRVSALGREVFATKTEVYGDKGGPVVALKLDVPARGAVKIKRLAGRAEVSRMKAEAVEFADLSQLLGKRLEHPLLKDIPIIMTRADEEKETTVNIDNAAKTARVLDWDVTVKGKRVRWNSQSAGEVVTGQTYDRKLPAAVGLVLQIAVPVETKVYEFQFENIDLP